MKLVIPEAGSDDARRLYASANELFSSRLLVPEASAAIGRAERMGRLAARALPSVLAAVQGVLRTIVSIEVSPLLADHAAELARSQGLRAYDAVHLATYRFMESPTSVLVAADGELIRAARALGHTVAVPGRAPG